MLVWLAGKILEDAEKSVENIKYNSKKQLSQSRFNKK